jgi:hypothetical protein
VLCCTYNVIFITIFITIFVTISITIFKIKRRLYIASGSAHPQRRILGTHLHITSFRYKPVQSSCHSVKSMQGKLHLQPHNSTVMADRPKREFKVKVCSVGYLKLIGQ